MGVHGADTIQQSLSTGLLDELSIDIAAVCLGAGVRLFDHLADTRGILGNPTVIPGVGVTHLRYPVCRVVRLHQACGRYRDERKDLRYTNRGRRRAPQAWKESQ